MPRVFIFGAGASYGENLDTRRGIERAAPAIVRPPMIDGFFRKELWDQIGYTADMVERDFTGPVQFIRYLKQLGAAPGEGGWASVNLEEIFTAMELEREFQGAESDAGARLTLWRNQLVRFIGRILAFCTQDLYGKYTRVVAASIGDADSAISFNYDTLLDIELGTAVGHPQYQRFFEAVFPEPSTDENVFGHGITGGMLLKMHGSLNWIHCTNSSCPNSSLITLGDTEECLNRAIGIHAADETCSRCGSFTIPLLIPPLLRKPIAENWIFRAVWGLARRQLGEATAVIIIGFSVPPSDFYASWLLQSTVGVKNYVPVYIVNPANDPAHPDHGSFSNRMHAIFPHGYNAEFRRFEQIEQVIATLGERGF